MFEVYALLKLFMVSHASDTDKWSVVYTVFSPSSHGQKDVSSHPNSTDLL